MLQKYLKKLRVFSLQTEENAIWHPDINRYGDTLRLYRYCVDSTNIERSTSSPTTRQLPSLKRPRVQHRTRHTSTAYESAVTTNLI